MSILGGFALGFGGVVLGLGVSGVAAMLVGRRLKRNNEIEDENNRIMELMPPNDNDPK